MSVKIRMQRKGRNNLPYYRIVATDTRFKRDGKCLEVLGTYNPLEKDAAKTVVLKADRVQHWIANGAVPSPRVATFIRKLKNAPKAAAVPAKPSK